MSMQQIWAPIGNLISFIFVMWCVFLAHEGSAAADDVWVVRRNLVNGSCLIEKATASNIGGEVARASTRKDVCNAAKNVKSEDPSDKQMCYFYNPSMISVCQSEGVDLPK